MGYGKLIYSRDDTPPLILSGFLGFQHLILVFGSYLTPVVVARAANLPASQANYMIFVCLLNGAIWSFIQIRRFGGIGAGYMVFMACSGAFIPCSIAAAVMGGMPLVATMTLLSAPLEILCSWLLRYLRRIITPVVGGATVLLVAVMLIPITMKLWTGFPGSPGYCSLPNLIVGSVTIITTLALSLNKRPILHLLSPVLGITAGCFISAFAGLLDLHVLSMHPIFGLPGNYWPGFVTELNISHLPVFLAFLLATLASTVESFGDAVAVQQISLPNFRKIDYDSVQGCLYADSLGTISSALLGGLSNTTGSSNIAAIGLTGVASRRIGYFTCVMMMTLAFMPKVTWFVLSIPSPVLGGATFVMISSLLAAGIRVILSAGLNRENGMVVGLSLTVGIISISGLFFPELVHEEFRPFMDNAIAMGGLTAIVLNSFMALRSRPSESFDVAADILKLTRLQEVILSLKDSFRLPESRFFPLQLACEDVFSFLCRSAESMGGENRFRFRWSSHPQHIEVEVEVLSAVEDVDLLRRIPTNEALKPADMERLGLLLLGRVAEDVRHIRTDGRSYVSFKISRN